jgi:hypothetical protein
MSTYIIILGFKGHAMSDFVEKGEETNPNLHFFKNLNIMYSSIFLVSF